MQGGLKIFVLHGRKPVFHEKTVDICDNLFYTGQKGFPWGKLARRNAETDEGRQAEPLWNWPKQLLFCSLEQDYIVSSLLVLRSARIIVRKATGNRLSCFAARSTTRIRPA